MREKRDREGGSKREGGSRNNKRERERVAVQAAREQCQAVPGAMDISVVQNTHEHTHTLTHNQTQSHTLTQITCEIMPSPSPSRSRSANM